MSITKNQIKKVENQLKELEPRYEWMAIQHTHEPSIIVEIKDGHWGRRIESKSKEGQKLLKEDLVRHPKVPIIYFDKNWN